MVPSYPSPDSKVRTTSYHEVGGGNAANTACAMSLLLGSDLFHGENGSHGSRRYTVRLATKIGGDYVGEQIMRELTQSGVDLSSPLFRIGDHHSATGFTTIVVAAQEQTRTCIHTPGTCGELTMDDLQSVSIDEIFENVVHLHSDSRQTEVALALAREARRRGVPVSLDVEKDRGTKALDSLLEEATIVFTNSGQIKEYLNRLNLQLEESKGREHLSSPVIAMASGSAVKKGVASQYASAISPTSHFARWFPQERKEVVITNGSDGAFHVSCEAITADADIAGWVDKNKVLVSLHDDPQRAKISHTFIDQEVMNGRSKGCSASYLLVPVGIFKPRKVVDTTGAGDAFIAGFLAGRVANFPTLFNMKLGAWVSGRKVEGPGARSSLPNTNHVNETLGKCFEEVDESLSRLVGSFAE
jgi:sugar/nucleoside kinase (ribokinase family)